MALPDISNLSAEELRELIANANLLYAVTEAGRQEVIVAKKVKIEQAIASLETLLGPVDATPNLNNIRGVLGYTEAQMAANSGIALKLAFQGLEVLTKTVLDVAYVVA